LDRTYVSGIERGKRNLTLRNIEVIANALDISVSDLTNMSGNRTILETLGISAEYLTAVVNGNPSLRGMISGYIAERKLHDVFEQDNRTSKLRKEDDHDRTKKCDLVVTYKGFDFKVEVKSLQTNTIQILGRDGDWIPRILKMRVETTKEQSNRYNYIPNTEFNKILRKDRRTGQYRGAVQCDASDRREVKLPNGKSITTTCLKVGEFDILAVGLFGFREEWDFGFALNEDLPRSNYAKYPSIIRNQLLKTLIPVTWPLAAPYVNDPFILLDKLVREKQRKIC